MWDKDPGINSVEYQGKGRYKVRYEKSGKPGEPLDFLEMFSVRKQADGAIVIASVRPSAGDLKQLSRIGATIAGQLSVSVPSSATVIHHNCNS